MGGRIDRPATHATGDNPAFRGRASIVFFGGLLFLVFVSLVGAALWAFDLPRAFFVHGVFALAALPLMWAAMLHFVPVLTRSGAPARGMRMLPWLAMAASAVLLATLGGMLPRQVLLVVALVVGSGAVVLLAWAYQRARRAIGKPHPGVSWYLGALGMLVLALAAVFGMVLDASRFVGWYRLHLHLNLFGWVGLTVLGTLPVLLPTCLSHWNFLRSQKNAPNATFRLRIGLPWAIFGALAIALAAAFRVPVLAAFGALALMSLIGAHCRAWLRFYGAPWRWPGPGQSLFFGAGFLLFLLGVGIAHGFSLIGGSVLLPAFVAGFLLPTVLGALAQLLPVWKFSGPDSPARQAFASVLAQGAGARGVLCVLSGLGSLVDFGPSLFFAALAVLWLLVVVLWVALRQSAQPPDRL